MRRIEFYLILLFILGVCTYAHFKAIQYYYLEGYVRAIYDLAGGGQVDQDPNLYFDDQRYDGMRREDF